MSKRVLVACGTGAATSTVVANKVKDAMAKAGIAVEVSQCKVVELDTAVARTHPDVVVVTGVLGRTEVAGVPVVRGFSFLTGVGVDAVVEELKRHLLG